MSNTRRSTTGEFNPQGYASSRAYEKGLQGNLVAKRAAVIDDPQSRADLYFLQQMSLREGGLDAVAQDIRERFDAGFGTATMHAIGREADRVYTPSEVKRIMMEGSFKDTVSVLGGDDREPRCASELLDECRSIDLARVLKELCTNPEIAWHPSPNARRFALERCPFWFYHDLPGVIRTLRIEHGRRAASQLARTSVLESIFDVLDYGLQTRSFVIVEGLERMGKTVAARNFCEQHIGQAVYVALEAGTDQATLFRSIARALGTTHTAQRKSNEIRMRIEDTLMAGHLMLVIDEAHFLWPQAVRARNAPDRMDWLRTALIDNGVPVALLSTPQFNKQCQRYAKEAGWNARQLKGRVALHKVLETTLSNEDILKIAKHRCPQLRTSTVASIALKAATMDQYVAAIERVAKRADYFASQEGRSHANDADARRALDELFPEARNSEPERPMHKATRCPDAASSQPVNRLCTSELAKT